MRKKEAKNSESNQLEKQPEGERKKTQIRKKKSTFKGK